MHLSLLIFFALIGLSTSALLSQRSQGSNRSLAFFQSPSQLLHRVCRWTTLCKTQRACAHVVEEARGGRHNVLRPEVDASAKELNVSQDIPSYVFDFAPLVHLYSGEKFWPCDIAEHLEHVTPYLNYTQMRATSSNLNLTNLDQLNEYERGRSVYLKSNDNVEARPDWLGGEKNIPNDPEDMQERPSENRKHPQRPLSTGGTAQLHGGRSDAPAVLVVIDKGNGIIDAFWFFFYSYNLGNLVFNVRFGNHVGDWEHTLIRFHHGKPKYVFLSEHYFGQAYTYDAVEKFGKRPVAYSAVGTHAMYATPGHHPYILPLGLLHDETDRGPLWDPALNALSYTYNHHTDRLSPSTLNPYAPTEWFYFNGHWGDRFYPLDDNRQYEFAGQYHYVNGPLGPRWKHLGRRKLCQGRYDDPCEVHRWLPSERVLEEEVAWDGEGEGEDWKGDERDPPGME